MLATASWSVAEHHTGENDHFHFRLAPAHPYIDSQRDHQAFGYGKGRIFLSEDNHRQLWIPPGFAHGFAVTSGEALFSYKCTAAYAPECELAIRWNDPAIGIEWPLSDPELLPKDAAAPLLADVPDDRLPE